MIESIASQLPLTDKSIVEVCQCIPGALLATGRTAAARDVLIALASLAGRGYLPTLASRKRARPDVLANLWFIQASYGYYCCTRDTATWHGSCLPLAKRIGQGIISDAFGSTRMSDGGMLSLVRAKHDPDSIVRNALWYNAMTILAEELHNVGDRAGDHFDRLAGRFRRSFLKTYWCEYHECMCDPAARERPEHVPAGADHARALAAAEHRVREPGNEGGGGAGGEGDRGDDENRGRVGSGRVPAAALQMSFAPGGGPDAEQLLLAVLPFSPIPRTKQRQIVDTLRRSCLDVMGLRIFAPRHVRRGAKRTEVSSPLYLAWLAEAHVRTSDSPTTAIADAQGWLNVAHRSMRGSADGRLARYYTEVAPAARKDNPLAHGPSIAEVRRVWLSLQVAAEKSVANSKRGRITSLMPGVDLT